MKKMKMIVAVMLLSMSLNGQKEIAFLGTDFPDLENNLTTSNTLVADFQIVNGLIIINGELEGEEGAFILDTGAPGLVVNEQTTGDPDLEGRGIGGEVAVAHREISHMNWAGLELEGISGYSVNMDHLERSIQRNLLGLVGFDLLEDYEILIDYQNQMIRLFPKHLRLSEYGEPKAVLNFELDQHLPVVKMRIGKKKLRFGLDCGATVNLIHQRYKDLLDDQIDQECCMGFLRGLDGRGELSSIVQFKDVTIGKSTYEGGDFQWSSFNGLSEQGINIDGLLGAEFFGNYLISIDYKKRKLYLW